MISPRHQRQVSLLILALLLALAFVVPRAVQLRGVELVSHLSFLDMHGHLNNLDLLTKESTLPALAQAHPYLKKHNLPARKTYNPMRWPHGVYRLGSLWSRVFGPSSPWTLLLTNTIFALVLVLGVVGLGALMAGVRTGLWAALLTLLLPSICGSAGYFHLDYGLVGMVMVGFYLLLRSDNFAHRRFCLALALWSVLGLWVKLTYALYLLAPAVLLALRGLRRRGIRHTVALHLGLGMLGVTALTFVLQQIDPSQLWLDLRDHLLTPLNSNRPAVEPWTARWALLAAIFTYYGFPWPLLFPVLPGLIALHNPLKSFPFRGPLLAYIWGAYIILTAMANNLERYVQPVYPLLCLLACVWVARRLPPMWRFPVRLWTATLFAAVLWLCHIEPPPWYDSEALWIREQWLYETKAARPEVRARLAANRFHTDCRMGPLLGAIRRMGRRLPLVPLVVLFDDTHEGEGPLSPRGVHLENYLLLYTQHLLSDRYVFEAPLLAEEPWERAVIAEAPALLVLHSEGQAIQGKFPRHEEVRAEAVSLICRGRTVSLALTGFTVKAN